MGEREIRALDEGGAVVDLADWRKVLVGGADAVRWLDDLVTNRVDDIGDGEARRTLFLSRTGHVRADVHVIRHGSGLLLLQDPGQPKPIDGLLAPYVLSSDVSLGDASSLDVVAMPVRGAPPEAVQPFPYEGLAAVVDEAGSRVIGGVTTLASDQDLEVWRIRRGIPRFGIDFGDESLPQEAGLDPIVDATKGCFLGQEAMAKVRNLGHPPWVVVSFRSETTVEPGQPVMAGDEQAGHVTSAARAGSGWTLLARIRWGFRDVGLRTIGGNSLLTPGQTGS